MWQDLGTGVYGFRRHLSTPVAFGQAGLQALDCISVPLALVDLSTMSAVWKNKPFSDLVGEDLARTWAHACQAAEATAQPSALKTMIASLREVMANGGCVDFHISRPVLGVYTAHCHRVCLDGREVLTVQTPSFLEPPQNTPNGIETGLDRGIRLIDAALSSTGRPDSLLLDLRQRMLDGRMHEPIFKAQVGAAMSWNNSASLAIMLGLPLENFWPEWNDALCARG